MIWWALLYVAGMVATTTVVARWSARDFGDDTPDTDDWGVAVAVSALWPLLWAGVLLVWPARRLYRAIYGEEEL